VMLGPGGRDHGSAASLPHPGRPRPPGPGSRATVWA
jgi:hypothetical protein